MNPRRLAPLVLLAGALLTGSLVARRAPKDQTVRVVLGDGAKGVTDVALRYSSHAPDGTREWLREAHLAYAPGAAPRIVRHDARLADGDYALEIALTADGKTVTVQRRVTLAGSPLSIDVAQEVPR